MVSINQPPPPFQADRPYGQTVCPGLGPYQEALFCCFQTSLSEQGESIIPGGQPRSLSHFNTARRPSLAASRLVLLGLCNTRYTFL